MLTKIVSIIQIALAALYVIPSQAQPKLPYGPTSAELAMLPAGCQARLGSNAELRALWSKRIGADKFIHLHHYCIGLAYLSRARVTLEKNAKRGSLQTAIGEFNYVLRNWPADFALAIDAKDQKSIAETMLAGL